MLDFDLAEMYQVETKVLKRAVRRNIDRFPADFMFEISINEFKLLIVNNWCQIGTSSQNIKHNYSAPFAFTEQGVAMLSGILKSKTAIDMNIAIMRAFVMVRNIVMQGVKENTKLAELESRMKALEDAVYDLSADNQKEFDDIYLALSQMASKQKQIDSAPNANRNKIGYKR